MSAIVRLAELGLHPREGRLRAREPECDLCGGEGVVPREVPAHTHAMYAHLPGAAEPIMEYAPCECGPARQAARRVNGARLPHIGLVASLDNAFGQAQLDVTAVPEVAAQLGHAVQVARAFVAALGGPSAPLGLAIAGGPRAGKTHLLAGIGLAAAMADQPCRYMAWAELLRLWEAPSEFNFDPRDETRLVLIDDVSLGDGDEGTHHFMSLLNQRVRLSAPTVVVFRDMDLLALPRAGDRSVASYLSSYLYDALVSGGAIELGVS